MYHNNQPYRGSAYGDRESEYENPYGNNEFNYESENGYELSPEYEFNNESEYNNEYESEGEYPMNEYEEEYEGEYESEGEYENQYEGEYESEGEYENQYEGEYEGEMQQEDESGGYKDEMEAELEYVTNEAEFNNWVNEIVVRDHRTRNMKPVLRTPIGRNAIRQFSKIAARTLPFLGRRRGGWTSPIIGNRFWNRPGNRWDNRWGNRWNNRFRHPHWRRHHGWRSWQGVGPGPFTNQSFQQQQQFQPQPSQGSDASTPQQPDGSFRNFILDTIKNLSEQIAAGNQSIEALKNSMANSATTNMPSLVQPKTDAAPPPGDTAPPPADAGGPQTEFEMEDYEYNMESEGEYTDRESGISEEQEMQLASELLTVNNESELDHFLGKLLKGAVSAVSGVLNSAEGKSLKKILKGVARKALPLAGGAIGSVIAPGVGTVIGKNVGDALVSGEIFELELEGMSNEDREFETARAFVRFGANAANQLMSNRIGSPLDNVRRGVTAAATRFAPGLLLRGFGRRRRFHRDWFGGGGMMDGGQSGTWFRRGNKIIIENA